MHQRNVQVGVTVGPVTGTESRAQHQHLRTGGALSEEAFHAPLDDGQLEDGGRAGTRARRHAQAASQQLPHLPAVPPAHRHVPAQPLPLMFTPDAASSKLAQRVERREDVRTFASRYLRSGFM